LRIDEVIHKVFVAVDENGTKVARATVVFMAEAAPGQPQPISFTMDQPFNFLIRDTETNTILFIGRVLNPLSSSRPSDLVPVKSPHFHPTLLRSSQCYAPGRHIYLAVRPPDTHIGCSVLLKNHQRCFIVGNGEYRSSYLVV